LLLQCYSTGNYKMQGTAFMY